MVFETPIALEPAAGGGRRIADTDIAPADIQYARVGP